MAAASRPTKNFRSDIQALRAIAVLLVIGNHFWPNFITGGYIGVDIFFVISGYLITLHLLKELRQRNTVSFKHFYANRARRLLPAAIFVGAVSFIATLALAPVSYWGRTAWDFFAASAYFHNWNLYASATDYFAQDSNPTVFQHYWSLSVEEQFYLIWPIALTLLFLGAFKVKTFLGGNSRLQNLVLGSGVFTLLILSLAFAQSQVASGQAGAYFNTFTRVWEFMVGALVALLSPLFFSLNKAFDNSFYPKLLRNLAQLAAYLVLLSSAFLYTEESGVPGLSTLAAVLAAAAVIATGPFTFMPWLRFLVEGRPTQSIGDMSYSLYLWHWPVAVLLPFALGHAAEWWTYIVVLPLVFLLAFTTQKFIENTFRFKFKPLFAPKTVFISVIATLALIGTSSVATHFYAQQYSARQQAEIQASMNQVAGSASDTKTSGEEKETAEISCVGGMALVNAEHCKEAFTAEPIIAAGSESEAPWIPLDQECEVLESTEVPNGGSRVKIHCNYAAASADPTKVWFIGDSHIDHWRPAVYPIAREKQWDMTFFSHSGCSLWETPLTYWLAPGRQVPVAQTFSDTCPKWPGLVLNEVTQEKPDLIVIGNYSSSQGLENGSDAPQEKQYAKAMKPWIDRWQAQGSKVVIVRDVPTAGSSVGPDCVSYSGTQCVAPASTVLWPDPQFEAARSLNIPTIDMTDYLCPDDSCHGVIGGIPVYFDTNHLSKSYSMSLSAPLSEKLDEALKE